MKILAVTNMYPTPQMRFHGTFIEQQVKGLKETGLSVEVMFLNRLQKGMRVYCHLKKELHWRIKNFRPDIVHVMYGGVMADRVTARVKDRPLVVTFHGTDLLGEQFYGPPRRVIAAYGVWASWRAARRATGVVVVSKTLQDALPNHIDLAKVRIIPCGIDLDRFRPLDREKCRQELGWRSNCFHVLFPSHRHNVVKRYDLACAAVNALRDLNQPVELHELDKVPHAEVPIWLNASDVLLLVSQHEGSPTIIKEALACNVPVVSLDVGDVSERIRGIDGCYLAAAEPDDLAAKLALVASDNRRVESRKSVEELSHQSIALRLKDFYNHVGLSFKSGGGLASPN